MEGMKKILVGIDFSDYSLPTLRYALALAQDTGASVVVVNVINERDVAAVRSVRQYTDAISVDQYVDMQKEERTGLLNQLLEEAGCSGVPRELVLKVGYPATEIIETIIETGADLVVVGTKGRTNLVSSIFGSVAEKVHRRSPVSFLSVRGKEHAELICKLRD
jgi:nucleotide-binding universal stress UspA family protein